ncbi:MAG TPA: phage tail protein [Candidatus Limnocylindrales bacterium]|nr:phage tail protein [Candidatus Limnocylindrales bacterium]
MSDEEWRAAASLRFQVSIDGGNAKDLGDWTKCDGLSVQYDVYEYKEGGENSYVHRIPGRASYQNVKLSRTIDGYSTPENTGKSVAAWLSSLATEVKRHTAEISLVDLEVKKIAGWKLQGVYPVRWSGPSLDAGSATMAMETLELAHDGFLEV